MDIKQLRALLTIAETGSVTKAATLLHIVQPAVSRQLALLEEEVGTALFTRRRHGMKLTDAGEIYVEHARRALAELDRARAEVQPSGEISGVVTIGLLPSTCDLLAGELVMAVAAAHPAVRLRISMGYTGHLQHWLELGEVDAALLYDPKPSPAMQVHPLLEESLWVVGRPEAGYRADTPLALAQLSDRPLILPNAPHGIRSLVEQACLAAGIDMSIVAETNAMSVQKGLVLSGLGETILPSIAIADDVSRGLLSAAPLSDHGLQRKIVLALPNTRRVPVAVTCVVNLLTSIMSQAVHSGKWSSAQWLAETGKAI